MSTSIQNENPQASVVDTVAEEGWGVLRTVRLPEGEITLVAVDAGYGWKATVEALPSFAGLEFYALFPNDALDQAEAFVRRLIAGNPIGQIKGH